MIQAKTNVTFSSVKLVVVQVVIDDSRGVSTTRCESPSNGDSPTPATTARFLRPRSGRPALEDLA